MAILTAKDKAEMAERAEVNRKNRLEAVRDQIQTQKLVEVLQNHALGKGRAKMTAGKLKAIEMLLDKSLPDLATAKVEVDAKQVILNITTIHTGKPPAPPVETVDG